MDIKQSSEKQGRPHHLSDSRTVLKRNFILIPTYILLQSIIPIIVVFGSLGITRHHCHDNTTGTTTMVVSLFIEFKFCDCSRSNINYLL